MFHDLLVVAQVVGRVVGGADGFDIEFPDQLLAAESGSGKFRVAFLEYVAGCGR